MFTITAVSNNYSVIFNYKFTKHSKIFLMVATCFTDALSASHLERIKLPKL